MRRMALAVAAVAGCSGPAAGAPAPASSCAGYDGLWAASNYSSSAVGAFSLGGRLTSATGVDLGADPALSVSRGRAFFVARDQDLVFELDPACGTPRSRFSVHQSSHSGSSDPQAVAVAKDGSLWVPLYDVPLLLVLGPTGGDVLRTIDLSPYDGDGNPQASAIAIVDTPAGEKAFVALERLADHDGLKAEQPSWMLRVDVATGKVEAHVALVGRNPFGMVEDGPILWLATPGNFDSSTDALAGVERFDTDTSTTALVVGEKSLGASVAEVAVLGGCGAAIVADATLANATSLVLFDPNTGAVIASGARSPLATDNYDLQGLAWKDGALLVGDRRRAATGFPVHVFEVTPSCVATERADAPALPLPPVALR